MYQRNEYIREAVALTANDTFRVDLPKHGYLSSLLLRISATEASGLGQSGGNWRLVDFISKIQILANGSKPIKVLDGKEANALAFYDEGVIAPDRQRNYASNTQFAHLLLNFGTYRGDPYYGLDLGAFDNVEFQLTNNVASSEFSSIALSILATFLEDTPVRPFAGYLRTEEWRKWTTVAAETQYMLLDTEYIIRRIMLRSVPAVDSAYVAKTGMSNLMETVKLALDTGKVVLHEGGIDDLMVANFYNYGKPILWGGFPYHFADKGIYTDLGLIHAATVGAGSQDGSGAATIPTMESARTDFTQKMETYEGDNPIGMLALGIAPYNTVMFRFDEYGDHSQWLNPNTRKTVKLDITTRNAASAADGTNYVILDRFVPF